MVEEIEVFTAKIIKIGTSKAITIPMELIKFTGWKEGDYLKIMARKKIKDDQ